MGQMSYRLQNQSMLRRDCGAQSSLRLFRSCGKPHHTKGLAQLRVHVLFDLILYVPVKKKFSYVGTDLPGLNQGLRTQNSDFSEAPTRNRSRSRQAPSTTEPLRSLQVTLFEFVREKKTTFRAVYGP